jgi:hypothetical protein
MKAQVFGQVLHETFSDQDTNPNFNSKHKDEVESYIKRESNSLFSTRPEDADFDREFSLADLDNCMESLKRRSAPGPDGIKNNQLLHLPHVGRFLLLRIANASWNYNCIIEDWKISQVTMIEKKSDDRANPKNYRPISLTNSVFKLIEKLIKGKMDRFLTKYKIINKFQSGFRKNRQTLDNLTLLVESANQAKIENPRNKVCAVVFDISKAFDKVWHSGLIFKLHKLNFPTKLGLWLINFLLKRKFYVKVNSNTSDLFCIETGVGQGSILSPTLFSIYINDIEKLTTFPNDKISSPLFADDLLAFNIDHNIRRLILQMQRYIYALQEWLNLWRLTIAAHKCSFSIYLGKLPAMIQNQSLTLTLYGEKIPLDSHPKYLGVTLDRNFNFNHHTDIIRLKCLKLLNILKSLSYKSWSANIDQQLTVYKTLIRSCMEYAPPLSLISSVNIAKLQGIQYQALRIIFKAPIKTSSTELHNKAKLNQIKVRLTNLSHKYLVKAINTNNELILNLLRNYNYNHTSDTTSLLNLMGIDGLRATIASQKHG